MTRRMYQEFDVFRGHHGLGGDPDQTSVGVGSWTPSLGAADLYAREASIEGMTPEAPIVSSRKYVSEYPVQFYEENVDIDGDLGLDLGFGETEREYIRSTYGEDPPAWQIMNDPNVQEMFRMHGADAVIYPEQVVGESRVDDLDGSIQTFRPLTPHKGDTSSIFVGGESMQVAGKFLRNEFKGLLQRLIPEPEQRQNFDNWFGQSAAVDADGAPVTLYHGTTQDIEAFDLNNANIESDWGAGIYSSTSYADAQKNYMGDLDPHTGERRHGVDLRAKIDAKADEIMDYLHEDPPSEVWVDGVDVHGDHTREIDYDKMTALAHEMATAELAGDAPNIMPLYASIQKPVHVGGPKETYWEVSFPDDDGDDMGEPAGEGMAMIEALGDALDKYDVGNLMIEQIQNEVLNDMIDYGGYSANRLKGYLISNFSDDIMDEEGKWAAAEVARQTMENMGYDGIIDHTVGQKFSNMHGIGDSTKHYILFKPEQYKSKPGNQGTYDPTDPDLNASVFTGEEYKVATNKFTRDAAKGLLSDFGRWLGNESPDTSGGRLMEDPEKLRERPSDVPQGDIPRYLAPKGAPASIAALWDEDNVVNVTRMAMRGLELGADAWYNLQPLRHAAHAALGAEAGDQMMQAFLRRVASTSPRGAVAQNITRASYFDWRELGMVPEDNLDYLTRIYGEKNVRLQDDGVYYKPASKMGAKRMEELGLTRSKDGFLGPFKRQTMEEILDQTRLPTGKTLASGAPQMGGPEAVSPVEAGYGHLAHKGHSAMLSEINQSVDDTFDEVSRPKAASFFWNLFGNWEPVTADSHFNRAIGLRNKNGKLKDTPTKAEYEYIERFTQDLAQQMGIAPAQLQAAVWMGAGDLGVTPVADPSIWMQMFNKQLDKTAKHRAHSYERVLHDFLTGKAPLLGAAPFAFLFGALGEPRSGEAD